MFVISRAWKRFAVWVLLILITASCVGDTTGEPRQAESTEAALRIGLLLNFSGPSERSRERQNAFDLAVKHVNEAGGVFGQPVEVATADSTLDPETAVAEARRLIEEEGIHALVGPSSSANALQVIEQVTGPSGIPTISPSATSPLLTNSADHDFFFRTALSDSAQGPVLARLTREQGFTNVGLIYRDDAWGQGLAKAFQDAWTGKIRVVAIEPVETATYLPQLRQVASDDAQALVLITYNTAATIIIPEAMEHGLFDQFALGDALIGTEVVAGLGGDDFRGRIFGSLPGAVPGRASTTAWEEAYAKDYGALPEFGYVKETYDAAIAIALAAEAAGSVDGGAIRDRLRSIGSRPGTMVIAGPEGIASALAILREGGEVDYDGAAVTLDWDEKGDLRRGHIKTWQLTEDNEIEELDLVLFEY